MIRTYRANLRTPGLTDVGYRLYDDAEVAVGARITAGVAESSVDAGWYFASVEHAEQFSGSIRWDSPSSERTGREEIRPAAQIATLEGWDAARAKIDALGSPVVDSRRVTPNDNTVREVWRGFDHYAEDGRALEWRLVGASAIALAQRVQSAKLIILGAEGLDIPATVTATSDGLLAQAEIGRELSALLPLSRYDCVVQAVTADTGNFTPIITGRIAVR